MTISSLSSYSYYDMSMDTSSVMNIPTFNMEDMEEIASTTSGLEAGESTMSLEDMQASMVESGGPKGPPPPPPADDMISSMVDSDEDDLWSVEELTDFSESLVETLGGSFDVTELMEEYDTDGDGAIDASERVAMKEDNAFNLSPPDENVSENSESVTSINSLYLEKALEAYNFSSNIQENLAMSLYNM